ncbi:unnamed protein product [Pylaiella littoralis]
MLAKAGADLEAKTAHGYTPLHVAVDQGHSEVVTALIGAGASCEPRLESGETPLHTAASMGHAKVVRVLLLAKANPSTTALDSASMVPSKYITPLDAAARGGHLDVVCELMLQSGIKGCYGASRGVDALMEASFGQYVDIMTVLMDEGVVDTGLALAAAAGYGAERSVKFLLKRQERNCTGARVAYVNNILDAIGRTPLFCAIHLGTDGLNYRRIMRQLIDAGADTTSPVWLSHQPQSQVCTTPLYYATRLLDRKMEMRGEKNATEKQLEILADTRRLLLRVEAVHAVSWLWPGDVPSIADGVGRTGRTKKTSTSLRTMLPIVRRTSGTHCVLVAALCRYSMKL